MRRKLNTVAEKSFRNRCVSEARSFRMYSRMLVKYAILAVSRILNCSCCILLITSRLNSPVYLLFGIASGIVLPPSVRFKFITLVERIEEQFTRVGYSEHNKHSDRQYRQSLRDTSFSGFIRPFSQFLPYLNCLGFALHARKAEAQIFGRLQGCHRARLSCMCTLEQAAEEALALQAAHFVTGVHVDGNSSNDDQALDQIVIHRSHTQ